MLDPAPGPFPDRSGDETRGGPAATAAVPRTWLDPWRLCLLLGLLGALPLVLLTPPFQAPDEPQHYFRAYQLSEGRIRSEVRDGKAGDVLPSYLPELAQRFLGTRELHVVRPVTPLPWQAELASMWDRSTGPEQREFVDFTGAATYSPLPYLPQALVIALGRLFGVGALPTFYLARLANAITGLVLVSLAIRLMPVGQRFGMLFALLPMAVFLYASLSPDTLVIATAFLLTAVLTRGCRRGEWTPAETATAIASGIVCCSLKPVYAPLLLLGLPAVLRSEGRKRALAVNALVCVVPLAATLLWLKYASSALVLARTGPSIPDQFAFIAADPLRYARLLYWTLLKSSSDYYEQMIGVLGWVNVALPAFAYALPLAALLLCVPTARSDTPRLALPAVAWMVVLVAGSALLVMTALYLTWTPVGRLSVAGVQGRYFLPLLAPVAVAMGSVLQVRAPRLAASSMLALIVVIGLLLISAQMTIGSAYGRLG